MLAPYSKIENTVQFTPSMSSSDTNLIAVATSSAPLDIDLIFHRVADFADGIDVVRLACSSRRLARAQPRNRATAQPRNRATAQPRNRATAQPRPRVREI
jgi:hypothetical protein